MKTGPITVTDYRRLDDDRRAQINRILGQGDVDLNRVSEMRPRDEFLPSGAQVFEVDLYVIDADGKYALIRDDAGQVLGVRQETLIFSAFEDPT